MLFAMAVTGALGLAFERVVIAPVYGQHLKQILITMGGMIVAEQILYAFFGPQQIPLPLPTSLRGSFQFGEAAVEKYRVVCVLVGLAGRKLFWNCSGTGELPLGLPVVGSIGRPTR